ncbi:hypothetical protein HYU19_02185 [Candidatus Woesearchaeota archaeon]|nr:hypothetical protein [Candidatus Woesearchaeota archaeon]
MGIVSWFQQLVGWGSSKEEAPQEAAPEEVSSVIALDQNSAAAVNDALESISSIKRAVEGGMDYSDAKVQAFARVKISAMRTGLRKMLDAKSVSRDGSDVRDIAKEFAALYGQFNALTYYNETFSNDFAELRDKLYAVEKLLNLQEPVLKAELSKVEEEM